MSKQVWICKWRFLVLAIRFHLVVPVAGYRKEIWTAACPSSILEPKGPKVFLTVSSLAYVYNETHIVERQLELNWYNANPEENDWVGLFDSDPNVNKTEPLAKIAVGSNSKGFHRTSIMLKHYNFTQSDFSQQCLDFWIVYMQNDHILTTDCLKIQPNWMWELREVIGNFTLSKIMLPGTHNSGSYQKFNREESQGIETRYTLCQEEGIWNQLVFGIRHLDLRMAYYSRSEHKFWLNHDFIPMHPFRKSLDQIKEFINATKEILILDFHRFPVGFNDQNERHWELINLLEEELKEFIIPRSYGFTVTLNQLWSKNKRLLLMYSSHHFTASEYLWPGLSQRWADTNNISELKLYIDNYMNSSTPFLWSAMAELTPTIWDMLIEANGSLRVSADRVNRNVTEWFRDEWWDRSNIIATDYFLGNNIIDVAIKSNKKRKMCTDFYFRPNNSRNNDFHIEMNIMFVFINVILVSLFQYSVR